MPRIFVSYSHQDETWKKRVVQQLSVLAPEGLDTWDDRRISTDSNRLLDIEQAIDACDVALLLISPDFLTPKFIQGQKVPRLLQRREQQGVRVIPVIVSPGAWTKVSWLSPIQVRPKNCQPLSGMDHHHAQTALVDEMTTLAEARSSAPTPGAPMPPERIDLTRLPAGAFDLQGRDAELETLTTAWNSLAANDLGNLSDPDGAQLLQAEVTTLAGKSEIDATDPQLQTVSHAVKGHALTLLDQYLKRANGGDIRPWKEIDWAKASDQAGATRFASSPPPSAGWLPAVANASNR